MPDPSVVRFRRVVEAAYAHLDARRNEVNDLNVYPVADGDTGAYDAAALPGSCGCQSGLRLWEGDSPGGRPGSGAG